MGDQGSPTSAPRKPPVPALLLRGNEVPLKPGETVIGRSTECHVGILGGLVSRRHAVISNQGGKATVVDLGSKNGVFVNGQKIEGPVELHDGDTLLIGTTELNFFLGPPDESEPISMRLCFDAKGNLLDGASQDDWGSTTQIRLEAPTLSDFDMEDATPEGVPPPPPSKAVPMPAQDARIVTQPSMTAAQQAQPVAYALDLDLPTPESGALRKSASGPAPSAHAVTGDTLPSGLRPDATAIGRIGSPRVPSSGPFPKQSLSDPLDPVLDVVTRMHARGDTDAAARALATHVTRRIETAREGHAILPHALEKAAALCLELTPATGETAWFDAAVDLYEVSRTAMSLELLDRVEELLPKLPQTCRQRWRIYQNVIREVIGDVDPNDLDACDRILCLGND